MSDPKQEPETLALRAAPRPITRLNRRLLIISVSCLAALVLGVTLWSLRRDVRLHVTPAELHNVERIAQAEGLDRLPPDYSKLPAPKVAAYPAPPVPVLGEPLPGDLGEPMLPAGVTTQAAAPIANTVGSDSTAEALRAERMNQQREIEEAAKAPLFFRAGVHAPAGKESTSAAAPLAATPSTNSEKSANRDTNATTLKAEATSAGADQKQSFLSATPESAVISARALQQPLSPYQVMAGTIISAALVTGINSDLPGTILATVTEPVYDSKLGRFLLIPQGTRLMGEYDSKVAFGERRVLLVWNRMVFPDGSSMTLDRLSGVDARGNAGLQDGVDRHWGQLIAGAALSTLIGVGAELAAPDRSGGQGQVIVSARQSVEDSINQVGQEFTRRNLNVQPTLTVRAGFPLRVIVSKDLALKPYLTSTVGYMP